MMQILERIHNIKTIIKENLSSQENPIGVLTRQEQAYLGCLETKHVQLEELFRKDEAHWAENFEGVKR